jgi:hypothetical protein
MNIKADNVFIYVLNIAGAIVSQDSSITPKLAVERAFKTLCYAEKCGDAWAETHDEEGKIKNPLELLTTLHDKIGDKSREILEQMISGEHSFSR